jgi:hypothetical protein
MLRMLLGKSREQLEWKMFWTLSSGIFVSENKSWTNFTKACLRIGQVKWTERR